MTMLISKEKEILTHTITIILPLIFFSFFFAQPKNVSQDWSLYIHRDCKLVLLTALSFEC